MSLIRHLPGNKLSGRAAMHPSRKVVLVGSGGIALNVRTKPPWPLWIIVVVGLSGMTLVSGVVSTYVWQLPFDEVSIQRASRAIALGGVFVSAVLVTVTGAYLIVTDRMARASERQTARLTEQLDLEYSPNLLLVTSSDYRMCALINLGKHQVWVARAYSDASLSPDRNTRFYSGAGSLDGYQKGLAPGEYGLIWVFPDRPDVDKEDPLTGNPKMLPNNDMKAKVKVLYFYGSTGNVQHANEWMVSRDKRNPNIVIVGTPRAPPWPKYLARP